MSERDRTWWTVGTVDFDDKYGVPVTIEVVTNGDTIVLRENGPMRMPAKSAIELSELLRKAGGVQPT